MGSKYLDFGLAIFMGYFAVTRFMNEQYGFAAMFGFLALLNILSGVVKHNKIKNADKSQGS